MIKDRNIFFIGLFILITQYFLGVPTFWKNSFITLAAFAIMFLSSNISMPKKVTPRTKTRKEKATPVFVESAPIYPKDNTIESADIVDTGNNQSPL